MEARNLGFVMTEEDLSKTTRLSDHDFRAWIVSCVHYMSRGELPDDEEVSPIVSALFDFTIPRMNTNIENYEKRVAVNKENGKKGGRPRKQPPSEIETQHNPENPMGFSETQHNPENHKPNPNPNPIPKPISIPTSTMEEERVPEEIEGCGGKEEPKSELQKLQASDRDEDHNPEVTVEVDYSTGNYYEVQNGRRREMSPFEIEQYTQELKRRAFKKLYAAGGITND